MEKLDKKLKLLPDSGGVYLMKNGRGKIIYVGKALSLRKRVRNYFSNSHKEPKMKALAETVRDIDYILTGSQSEALILECNLIKKHHPRYNVQLRDDKRYPCIRISDDIFPRISIVRTIRKDNSRYFGPYTNAGAVRRTLRLMRNLFMLRSCRRDMSSVSRPCLYYHLGQCMAPCTGKVSKKEYAKMVRSACLFLEGKAEELLNELIHDMEKESKALRFEKASAIRDRISALREVIEGQNTAPAFKFSEFEPILSPEVGKEAVASLKKLLKLNVTPSRIEAFDVSQTSGTEPVGSVVVFDKGKPQNSSYRRFRIKFSMERDDCAMISEIVRRRHKRALAENNRLPDLIIIDGGPAQVKSANAVLRELDIADIPVIGLAKRFEHVFTPGGSKPLILPANSSALRLIMYIRDEAHRFAVRFHRRRRGKRMRESILDEIPGLGKKRKQLLLSRFKSVTAMAETSQEELEKLDGIGPQLAKLVKAHLTVHG